MDPLEERCQTAIDKLKNLKVRRGTGPKQLVCARGELLLYLEKEFSDIPEGFYNGIVTQTYVERGREQRAKGHDDVQSWRMPAGYVPPERNGKHRVAHDVSPEEPAAEPEPKPLPRWSPDELRTKTRAVILWYAAVPIELAREVLEPESSQAAFKEHYCFLWRQTEEWAQRGVPVPRRKMLEGADVIEQIIALGQSRGINLPPLMNGNEASHNGDGEMGGRFSGMQVRRAVEARDGSVGPEEANISNEKICDRLRSIYRKEPGTSFSGVRRAFPGVSPQRLAPFSDAIRDEVRQEKREERRKDREARRVAREQAEQEAAAAAIAAAALSVPAEPIRCEPVEVLVVPVTASPTGAEEMRKPEDQPQQPDGAVAEAAAPVVAEEPASPVEKTVGEAVAPEEPAAEAPEVPAEPVRRRRGGRRRSQSVVAEAPAVPGMEVPSSNGTAPATDKIQGLKDQLYPFFKGNPNTTWYDAEVAGITYVDICTWEEFKVLVEEVKLKLATEPEEPVPPPAADVPVPEEPAPPEPEAAAPPPPDEGVVPDVPPAPEGGVTEGEVPLAPAEEASELEGAPAPETEPNNLRAYHDFGEDGAFVANQNEDGTMNVAFGHKRVSFLVYKLLCQAATEAQLAEASIRR